MTPSSVRIGVVIPCYRVSAHVAGVIAGIPDSVSHIIAVDDACPARSGDVAGATGDPRVTVLRHAVNQGVGGAMVTGYRKALELGCDIVVKVDGDGQMDTGLLDRFAAPLAEGAADYVKGNRFSDFKALRKMPRARLFGNSVLSFLVKAASGYWSLMDPTNGYTAIHRRALENLDLEALSRRYFFESDMLIRLNVIGAVVRDLPIPARYGDEGSSLSIPLVLIDFPPRLIKGLLRRIALKYFIYDFNVGSLYLAAGLPLMLFGTTLGALEWIDSIRTGIARPSGTVMLVALPLILGFQLLLQAIAVDIAAEPRRRP
ncbi:MAG: glycosyltransferase family 2 protein [Alphaproteobacteria bacterium]|nr:glycosyltransferase family 2 protein [Alphaproteobacteria bacterium]